MTERWKTLSRRDPEFIGHLEGTFSETHRALPQRSLNVETQSELVTFEIVPIADIQMPPLARVLTTALRPASVALSIGPMLTTWVYCWAHGLEVNAALAVSCFVGVVALHVALNLFNDYNDHMSGQDRLRPHGGSRVIQKGWVRAVMVKRAAWGLMGFAVLCGLPSLFLSPVAIVAGVVALVGLEFAFQFLGLKERGWAEVLAFAMTGPLLTSSFALAMTSQAPLAVAAMGCIFGAGSLLYFHSANFENILPDSQAGVRTWATRTGFDASKTFFHFVSISSFAASFVYVLVFERDVRMLPVVAVQAMFLIPVNLKVRGIASPLSSELRGLRYAAIRLVWWTAIALIGSYLLLKNTSLVAWIIANPTLSG